VYASAENDEIIVFSDFYKVIYFMLKEIFLISCNYKNTHFYLKDGYN